MDKKLAWFEKLYDSYADSIFRHIFLRLGNRERAKELTQDVFMKTWQYVALGKTIEYEKAFLYRVARNLFINEIRTHKRTTSLDTLMVSGFEIPDNRDMAESYAEHRELFECLGTLKDSYRTVLILRYVDELAVKEIAELLDESETNISMRIARALSALEETYTHGQNQKTK